MLFTRLQILILFILFTNVICKSFQGSSENSSKEDASVKYGKKIKYDFTSSEESYEKGEEKKRNKHKGKENKKFSKTTTIKNVQLPSTISTSSVTDNKPNETTAIKSTILSSSPTTHISTTNKILTTKSEYTSHATNLPIETTTKESGKIATQTKSLSKIAKITTKESIPNHPTSTSNTDKINVFLDATTLKPSSTIKVTTTNHGIFQKTSNSKNNYSTRSVTTSFTTSPYTMINKTTKNVNSDKINTTSKTTSSVTNKQTNSYKTSSSFHTNTVKIIPTTIELTTSSTKKLNSTNHIA